MFTSLPFIRMRLRETLFDLWDHAGCAASQRKAAFLDFGPYTEMPLHLNDFLILIFRVYIVP
jgi:hypothetical protein